MSFAAVVERLQAIVNPYPGPPPVRDGRITSVLRTRPTSRRARQPAGAQPLPGGVGSIRQRQILARQGGADSRVGARPGLGSGSEVARRGHSSGGGAIRESCVGTPEDRSRYLSPQEQQPRPNRHRAATPTGRRPPGRCRSVRGTVSLQGCAAADGTRAAAAGPLGE